MITEIGIVAGQILELLEEKKIPMSIAEIKIYLHEPADLIDMAIGWLIRENLIHVIRTGRKYLVLSEESSSAKVFESVLCLV